MPASRDPEQKYVFAADGTNNRDSKGNIYTGEVEYGKRVQKLVPVMAGTN